MAKTKFKFFVYIIECADGTLYTGYTTDVERRIKEHNNGISGAGARYTSGRGPVKLFFTESFATRSEAMKREAAIKKLTRAEKELLVKTSAQGNLTKRK